jgi:hypothetical protein
MVPAVALLSTNWRVIVVAVFTGASTVISAGVTINTGALPAWRAGEVAAPLAAIVMTKLTNVPANTITRRFMRDLLDALAD